MRPAGWLALALTWLVPTVAGAAAPSRQQACEIAKLRAAGAEISARLVCEVHDFAVGADPACLAAAAAHRDQAFRRAEARGGCATVGDSTQIGLQADYVIQNDVLDALRPDGPAPSRCTARLFALAGYAAVGLTGIYSSAARAPDQARLVARLDLARARAVAAYRRATALGDCLFAYPAELFYDSLAYGVESIRDSVCPGCGVRCPCWTTAKLDQWFPPGSFASQGGTSCTVDPDHDLSEGVTARDYCYDPRVGGYPMSGFLVFDGSLCLTNLGDTCGFPTVRTITAEQASACIDVMHATRIYRQECRVPQ